MKAKCAFMILLSLFVLYIPGTQAKEKDSRRSTEWKAKLKGEYLKSVAATDSNNKNSSGQLQKNLNLPRTGDYLIKLQASPIPPGEGGENTVWDLNNLQLTGGEYNMNYFVYPKSSMTAIESASLQYYHISGDSLLLEGYENPLSLVWLQKS